MTTPETGGEINTIPSTPDLIAGAGNHEAKALLMLYLDSFGSFQTESSMSTGFNEFIGPGAEWYPAQRGPFQYCLTSLEPTGQVVRGAVRSSRGRPIDAYKVSEFGQRIGLPTAGLLLEWSLDVPDLSVQKVFGPTHTAGAVRAPKNRLEVLTRLIESPSADLSTTEVAGLDSDNWGSQAYQDRLRQADMTIRALARVALVNIERQSEQNLRRYRILEVDSPRTSGANPGKMTTALRDYINRCYQAGEPEFSTEDCVAHVVSELQLTETELDPAAVRHHIITILSSRQRRPDGTMTYKYFPQLERLESPYEQYHTRITLNESYRAAVGSLLEIVMAIDRRDVRVLKRGRELAAEITADSEKKVVLLDKAYRFSAAAQRQGEDKTRRAVKTILEEQEGPVDKATIHQIYTERYRPVSQAVIGKALRQISKTKSIIVTRQRSRDSSLKRRNFYELADSSVER